MVETDFLSGENGFFLFNVFFLQAETITEISGNQFFFGNDFIPTSKKGFPVQWKQFSFIPRFFPAGGKSYWN